VLALLGSAVASAAHAASPRRASVRIAALTAKPEQIGASGGKVRIRLVVRGAASCRFTSQDSLKGVPSTRDCASGMTSITVHVPRNSGTARPFAVFATARSAAGVTAERRVVIVQSAVPSAPVVFQQPASSTVAFGTTATLSATASGYPIPTVQWQVYTNASGTWTWSNVPGATSTSYSFEAETGSWRAVFTNRLGSATTNAATLTVVQAPALTEQPSSQTVPSGVTFALIAEATGIPIPTVQWQASTDAGATWSNVSGATSTNFLGAAHALGVTEYRAVFTNSSGSVTTNPAVVTVGLAESSNWSGYVVSGATFSAVLGHWIVPTVSCSGSTTALSSEWVGIDGSGSPTVEQDGTETDCDSGNPTYYAWYEMYDDTDNPAVNNGAQVPLPAGHTVLADDAITATLSITGSTWTFEITDFRGGVQQWSYMTTVPNYSTPTTPAQSSAEWVTECPNRCAGPLADFGSVSFSSATAYAGGQSQPISAFSFAALGMFDGSTLMAGAGPLNSIGEGFTDSWASG
jgi:hypothetical protein